MVPAVGVAGGAPSSPCAPTGWRTAAAAPMIHTLEVRAALSLSAAATRTHSSSLFIFPPPPPPPPPDDCALLLLACLHCHFHDFMVLLPGALEGAVSRCFPSYRHVRLASEREREEKDCYSSKMELDCNCCGSCKDTGEFIEFAMEISEVCYRWGRAPPAVTSDPRNSASLISFTYSYVKKLPAFAKLILI